LSGAGMSENKNFLLKKIKDFNWKELFSSLLWAIIIALIFRTFLFEPYRIPSGSMMPTLRVGDYLFVNKFAYGYSKHSFLGSVIPFDGRIFSSLPKRGDIIVFKGVKSLNIFYIKRLIGLSGDVIQVKNGVLYINEQPLDRKFVGEFEGVKNDDEREYYNKYKEVMKEEGLEYNVLDANIKNHKFFPDNTPKYTVPQNHYFFMGDNRNNSIDSRFLNEMGYIPEDNLVGRAEFLFWTEDLSFVNLITKLDSGRSFKAIN
jgi:signal peptidase I